MAKMNYTTLQKSVTESTFQTFFFAQKSSQAAY